MAHIKTIIDVDKQIIVNTVTGDPVSDDYIEVVSDFMDKNPTENIVWDHTHADLSRINSEDLEKIIHFSMNHSNIHILKKVALILTVDLSYGIGRMFETLGEIKGAPWEVELFRTKEEAFLWLGIQDIRETTK